ncbi:DUF2961 domain-containing protein [Mycolicibacterium sp. S2-37]|uniref:DUF2961 domain-containing protein n=1 Tax=Mycolicibacterium sp. S2-37 TaxID=2810297 RepID=UPI001A9493EA|nr:DUF2961 domain-containing protein [Mycolicibacterium sp. S2-37]MBO0676837.1 DUF2961 domain-containing protein [Mycolicibacterium sp. S2-37]
MALYRTLVPVSYVSGNTVISITEPDRVIDLTPAQASALYGKVIRVNGPTPGPASQSRVATLSYDRRVQFPPSGSEDFLYLAEDTGLLYRWSSAAGSYVGVTTENTAKVDKVSTANRLYGTDSDGNQTTYAYSAIGGSAPAGDSGFPRRRPGQRSYSVNQEVATARAPLTAPAGAKAVVLAEVRNSPGVLSHIWMAGAQTEDMDGFLELGGIIRIYIDNAATPVVDMALGDFFCAAGRANVFATPRVGRTSRTPDATSGYRYLHAPFQEYMRVEVENQTDTDSIFYGQASYSTVDSFASFGDQQLSYTLIGERVAEHPRQTPLTICDTDGSGQLESIYVSFAGGPDDAPILEGNIEIYIDGELCPSWSSSGGEDAFNGGWYSMPVGGWPAGRAGATDLSGESISMYRFFVDDPIFFDSSIKVIAWAGQPGQATVASPTVTFAGYAGVWLDEPASGGEYLTFDGPTIFNTDFTQAELNPADWHQDENRVAAVATGSSITIAHGVGSAYEDVRVAPLNLTLPANYFVSTRCRITSAHPNQQEASIAALGATPSPWFGSAIHVQLTRSGSGGWNISVRDDFDTVFVTQIGSGRDLINEWIELGVMKVGNRSTAYYARNPGEWTPIGSWIPRKTETGLAMGAWTADAEFDNLVIRQLVTRTVQQ